MYLAIEGWDVPKSQNSVGLLTASKTRETLGQFLEHQTKHAADD